MNINPKIHNRNHILKSILGSAEWLINNSVLQKNELTVINYHGTPKKYIFNFKKQLNFFVENFSIISPQQLPDLYTGKLNRLDKPLLLITFDDGIKNNLYAAEILNELNIKAFFFIVPDFIDTSITRQKEYFVNYIRPKVNPYIDGETEDCIPLMWNDIKTLCNQGHSIGSHTKTHRLIANQSKLENSIIEIKESQLHIANELGVPLKTIDSFCSINNTLESISTKELTLIKENYQYHFTTIPGPNSKNSNPYFIKRTNIESHWMFGTVKYAIGKWCLRRWHNATNSYLNILNSINKH